MAVSIQPIFPFLPALSKAEVNLLLQVHTHNRNILYTHACVEDVDLTLVGLSDWIPIHNYLIYDSWQIMLRDMYCKEINYITIMVRNCSP